VHVTDTYFVVAHFHYIMVGGMVMAFMGGMHYWWPKITGRLYPEFLGKMAAIITFIGFNLTSFLNSFSAIWACPGATMLIRRVSGLPCLITAGASILGVGYLLPLLISYGP
jgi:cytochrome c oxidase subunit 1